MSPTLETGCSEVSTTVSILDGNTSTSKDDSSRSATTSPAIEQQKQKMKCSNDHEVRDVYEDQDSGDKVKANKNVGAQNIPKSRGDIINVEDVYDCQDEDIDSRMKKYDYLGMYNNRIAMSNNTGNGSINNNKKTNNSKVRLHINIHSCS
jgi:hypothetical protein